MTQHYVEKLVQAHFPSRLNYSLYQDVQKNSLRRLNATARFLTKEITVLLYWFPFTGCPLKQEQTYKVVRDHAPSYPEKLIEPYQYKTLLVYLWHPKSLKVESMVKHLAIRPPAVEPAPCSGSLLYLTGNQLPVQVEETNSLITFKIRLKTILFEKPLRQ